MSITIVRFEGLTKCGRYVLMRVNPSKGLTRRQANMRSRFQNQSRIEGKGW